MFVGRVNPKATVLLVPDMWIQEKYAMEKAAPSKTHMPKAMNTQSQTGGQTLKPQEAKALNVTKEHSVFLVELGWNVGRTANDSGIQLCDQKSQFVQEA